MWPCAMKGNNTMDSFLCAIIISAAPETQRENAMRDHTGREFLTGGFHLSPSCCSLLCCLSFAFINSFDF